MKKSKGFTIMEQMIALGIISIILCICNQLLLNTMKSYFSNSSTINDYSLRETTLYINQEIASIPESVDIKDNKISYTSRIIEGKLNKKQIFMENNTLYVKDLNTRVKSKIVNNVKQFETDINGSMVYMYIKLLNGEEIKECIVLKNI